MNTLRKTLISAGLVGSTLVGGALGAAMLTGTANAAETTTSTASAATPAATTPAAGTPDPGRHGGPGGPGGANFDPSKGGHIGANGVTEALLTGDTADKVKAAALAAVPGGTIERAENDAEGSPYEAHMTKADGSRVTVKVDSNFSVTNVENG